MLKTDRFRLTAPLNERLADFARASRAKASVLPPSAEREELLKKGTPSRDSLAYRRMDEFPWIAVTDLARQQSPGGRSLTEKVNCPEAS